MTENKRDVELFKKVVAELEKRKSDKERCEGSLWEFTKSAWEWIGEGPMVETRFTRELCRHLEAVYEGKIRRLLINVPPRSSKSLTVNVMFPVWMWIKDNKTRYMNVSYESRLAERDNNRSRRIINSPWFQNLWGDRVKLSRDQNTKDNIELESGGARMSFSIDGSITGSGANIICCTPYGEKIETEDGEIEIGKIVEQRLPVKVWSYNHDKKCKELKDIEEWECNDGRGLYEIELSDGKKVRCTGEHPVYVEGKGYIRADELIEGDEVKCV